MDRRKNLKYLPPKDKSIAMVFHNYALYPHMSTYEIWLLIEDGKIFLKKK